MTDIKLIYTTFNSLDNAKTVITQLLREKLIACANIGSNMQSIYSWEGKIRCENEVAVLLKTTDKLVDEAVVKLKKLHQYQTPCIIVLPVTSCDKDFLNWVKESLI